MDLGNEDVVTVAKEVRDREAATPEDELVSPDRARDSFRRRLLGAADILAVLAAAVIVTITSADTASAGFWVAALSPFWIVGAKLYGLYDADHVKVRHLTIEELGGLFHWITLSVAAMAVFLALLPGNQFEVQDALAMWVTALVTAALLRAVARAVWRRIVPPDRAVLIGDGPLADAFVRKLALEPAHHLHVVATVPAPDHASSRTVQDAIRNARADRVVVAVEDLDEETLARVLATCRAHGIKTSVAPPLRAALGTAVRLNHLAELPLIEFRTWEVSKSTMLLKRAFDVVAGTVLLIVLSPVLIAIAIAIKLDSRGPVFFLQTRAGKDGRPFRMVKFRTMVPDAEARLADLVDLEKLDDPMFKLKNDPRITRVGRILRRTSTDELAQLLNVIKGDMSLVGPRPEELRLVERYGEPARMRLQMRPGMTGPMQVHGRGELTFEERLSVDREYIENYSFRKDLLVLLRTLEAVFHARGAF